MESLLEVFEAMKINSRSVKKKKIQTCSTHDWWGEGECPGCKDSIVSKFGKPCKKCKGYHNTIATMGENVASGTRKEKCNGNK